MNTSILEHRADLPKRVRVSSLITSRYEIGLRPTSWEERVSGIDTIVGDDGITYKLQSDGGQSPPQSGWVILLNSGDANNGFLWTLYGISRDAAERKIVH